MDRAGPLLCSHLPSRSCPRPGPGARRQLLQTHLCSRDLLLPTGCWLSVHQPAPAGTRSASAQHSCPLCSGCLGGESLLRCLLQAAGPQRAGAHSVPPLAHSPQVRAAPAVRSQGSPRWWHQELNLEHGAGCLWEAHLEVLVWKSAPRLREGTSSPPPEAPRVQGFGETPQVGSEGLDHLAKSCAHCHMAEPSPQAHQRPKLLGPAGMAGDGPQETPRVSQGQLLVFGAPDRTGFPADLAPE